MMISRILVFAVMLLAFQAVPTAAQQTLPSDWQVSCRKGDCNMSNTINNGQGIVTNLNIYMVGRTPVLEYLIPLGMGLERGVVLQIDGQQAFRTSLLTCRANGCSGFVKLEKRLLDRLLGGGVLRVAFQNFADRKYYSFNFGLRDFASRYTAFRQGSAR